VSRERGDSIVGFSVHVRIAWNGQKGQTQKRNRPWRAGQASSAAKQQTLPWGTGVAKAGTPYVAILYCTPAQKKDGRKMVSSWRKQVSQKNISFINTNNLFTHKN
jgi:hypothetical protein